MNQGAIIRSRVPREEYDELAAVSITRLKELKRSGLHYRYRLANPATSSALTLGIAAHCAVLEPERFERQFAVWSRRSEAGNLCPRKGQHWDAFEAAHRGQDILTEDEASDALSIAHAVRSDPLAARYLEAGDPEVTLEWPLRVHTVEHAAGQLVSCKGRVDWLTRIDGVPYLVGLKSARDCRPMIFGSAAARLGYHLQWAFYFDGYMAITGVKPQVREIVVESAPPHDVVVYEITDDIIQQGRGEYVALLGHLRQCEERSEWLGVGNGTEQVLTLPTWAYDQHDDITDLGLE